MTENMKFWFAINFILLLFCSSIHAVDSAIITDTKLQQRIHEKEFLNKSWYKSTFPSTMDSVMYHTKKHGKGRSPVVYTEDALRFYDRYKQLGKPVKLHDGRGTPGIKIQKNQAGGYWTFDGKIVTFWD